MPHKILIVDDEPDIVEVLADRLEASGFDVRTVHNARDCYAAVAEDAPDLILLDIQMPDIGGMEALADLKKNHPEVPVLMISASSVPEVAQEAIRGGAEGFVLKPFEPEELMQSINEVLGES